MGIDTVPSGLGSVKSIAGGYYHTCVMKADDSVQCWGGTAYRQTHVPVGLGSVKRIFAGYDHTCAIKADDSVQCWGRDDFGQSSVPAELQ